LKLRRLHGKILDRRTVLIFRRFFQYHQGIFCSLNEGVALMIETLPESAQRPRLLQPFLDEPWLKAIVVSAAQQGVYRGMLARAESSWMPTIGPGMITYLHTCVAMGEMLDVHSFSKDETQNQPRFLAPENPGGVRLRLMVCQGDVQGNLAVVRSKGPVTRNLVHENAPHNPQLQLFSYEEVDGGILLNVWVMLNIDSRKHLTVRVAVFGSMNTEGTQMELWDSEPLGVYDMNLYEPERRLERDLPQAVVNSVILQEREEPVFSATKAGEQDAYDGTND
jgi:hypothetical protein